MKKKVSSILLALFMILGLVPTLTTTAQAADTTTWKDAYATFLKNPDNIKKLLVIGDSIDDACFSMRDIDNNGVPELIVSAGHQFWSVFTYDNDNGIKDIGFASKRRYLISSNAKYPGLFAYEGEQDSYTSYITIKNNVMTQVNVSEENFRVDSPKKNVFDNTLDSISEKATYLPTYPISNLNIANIITNYSESNTATKVTGWSKANGTWYYSDVDGSMKTGWLNDNGTWYYINADGAMAQDTITPDGYTVNASGAWTK